MVNSASCDRVLARYLLDLKSLSRYCPGFNHCCTNDLGIACCVYEEYKRTLGSRETKSAWRLCPAERFSTPSIRSPENTAHESSSHNQPRPAKFSLPSETPAPYPLPVEPLHVFTIRQQADDELDRVRQCSEHMRVRSVVVVVPSLITLGD